MRTELGSKSNYLLAVVELQTEECATAAAYLPSSDVLCPSSSTDVLCRLSYF